MGRIQCMGGPSRFGPARRPGCEPWWNTSMTSVPPVSPVSSAPTFPPAPDTLTSSNFPVLWPVGTRWADNDMFGHLNNAVYYQLFDTAINAWINTTTGLDPLAPPALGIVAESGCRYFSELHFPESLGVGIAVTRLGRSSVTYRLGVFRASAPTETAQPI